MSRWHIGRVRIDVEARPDWWREVGTHFTRERGDQRWGDIRSLQVHSWRWTLTVIW